jgi:cell division protein FtsI (penicillin-binding protein 3)
MRASRADNPRPEPGKPGRRLRWLVAGLALWAAAIAARLVKLQILEHDALRRTAEQQQTRSVELQAARGVIEDRNGQLLAISLPVDSVHMNPLRVPDPGVAADMLSGILAIDRKTLYERVRRAQERHQGFLWLKRKIRPDESERLRALKLDWLGFQQESERFYPNGRLAAHVLGGTGMISKEDKIERGNAGLELALDKELRGTSGSLRLLTDVHGRAFAVLDEVKSVAGTSVRLTLDSRIQHVAEREIERAVVTHRARTGSVVVMHPRTGDLLAVASYPAYDPNTAPSEHENPQARHSVPVSYASEPGSVFKVFTLAAALETTNLRPETPIFCGNGSLALGSRVIHDHVAHGTLSLADVLAKSSNVGTIRAALAVGEARLFEYVRRFGFGQPTGLPLPAESAGILRPLDKWGRTSIASVAMGHEIATTTVQLAAACAAIANGGERVRPRLILRKQRPGAAPEVTPPAPGERILKPETAIAMRGMMEGVVLRGTGKGGATLRGYTSGGKTGSAQIFDLATRKYTHTYNASFMGFAPVANPAVVVVVTLNGTSGGSAGFGGVAAAPVFREVAMHALRILDVPRDLPVESTGSPPRDPQPLSRPALLAAGGDPSVSSVTQPPVRTASGSPAPGAASGRRIFSEVSPAPADSPAPAAFSARGVADAAWVR